MSDSSPLDDLLDAPDPAFDAQKAAARQARWEERCVRQLLTLGGYSSAAQELARRHMERTGERGLSFAEFMEEYGGSFPAYLHFRKIPYLHNLTHDQIFKGPKAISKLFYDLVEDTPSRWIGTPRGVVFEWLHAGGAMKIIHNNSFVVRLHGVQLRWPIKRKHHVSQVLTMENFKDFLFNTGWAKSTEPEDEL